MYRAFLVLLALTATPLTASAQQPCTTDERRIVSELYRNILERQAEPGSDYWVRQLQSGKTVRDLVREFANSSEHTQRFLQRDAGETFPYERSVARLYQHVLARQPDAEGQRAYAELAQRLGADAVVDRIVNSAEYTRRFGDWGVPGSGGMRYCGPNNAGSESSTSDQTVDERIRFSGMDRNGDGVISRLEWRGSRQSFDNQDWNHDGVLSGDEVRPGGVRRPDQTASDRQARRAERFATLDINNNGRIEAREWDGTVAAFNRLDTNNDNILSRAEVVNPGVDAADAAAAGQRFDTLDVNNNGRIEAREWDGTVAAFNRLDVDNDNILSRAEVGGTRVDDPRVVATSGQEIRVESRNRWTDTFLDVRAGDMLVLDPDGSIRLSADANDTATVGGASSGRRASNAPFGNQAAGALIGRIGNGSPFFVGSRRTVRAPAAGRLFLGVNDDYLADNAGDFQVRVTVQR